MKSDFRRSFGGCGARRSWNGPTGASSGNAAFDEYRAAELRRLDEERRRLEDERAEFESFVQNLRRARDQEEFDRFKADRDCARRTEQSPAKGEDSSERIIDL